MEIVKVGTFVDGGYPQGWSIHPIKECKEGNAPLLDLHPNGDVFIGGVLMREMTEERKLKLERVDKTPMYAIRYTVEEMQALVCEGCALGLISIDRAYGWSHKINDEYVPCRADVLRKHLGKE